MSFPTKQGRLVQTVALLLVILMSSPIGCEEKQTTGRFQNKPDRAFAGLVYESLIVEEKAFTISCLEYFSLYQVQNEDGSFWEAIQSERFFDDSDRDGWGDCRSVGSVHDARSMSFATCDEYRRLLDQSDLQFYPVGSKGRGWCILSRNPGWFIIPYVGSNSDTPNSRDNGDQKGLDGDPMEYETSFFEEPNDFWCDGDCTDMDGDGLTWNDVDGDGDGLYESP